MQVQDATVNIQVNELKFGSNINQAVESGNRADFALLLAMLSGDVREIEPLQFMDTTTESENEVRFKLGVSPTQPLCSDSDTYLNGASIAHHFHSAGISSAKLQNGLRPDALAYIAENTQGLGEEVYRNLSLHEKKLAAREVISTMNNNDLYNKLIVATRTYQLQTQI